MKRSMNRGEATHLVANVTTRDLERGEDRYSCNFGLAYEINTVEMAEHFNERGFSMFAREDPVTLDQAQNVLDGTTQSFYHTQDGADADPITSVQTGLTEQPDDMKQIAEQTKTPESEPPENPLEYAPSYDNIFNHFPRPTRGNEETGVRNPLDYCRSQGPCPTN